jgi:Met-zincin/Domain of unknown function (DUF5117)
MSIRRTAVIPLLCLLSAALPLSLNAQAQAPATPAAAAAPPAPPEYPPFSEVSKGHDLVVSTTDGSASMYSLYVRRKDNHVLAELPPGFASKKYFLALTVAGGESYAGLQAGDTAFYWRAHDKRLALIEPNYDTRSTGDPESQSSVKRLYTDRLLTEVPIVAMGPRGGPVIDLNMLLVGQAARFFGPAMQTSNPQLAVVKTAKAFPHNVELAFEAPMSQGRLKTLHYSISEIPESSGYKPRMADQRVGYFTTSFNDHGKFQEEGTAVRYINRWRVEKRDPALKLSPPKNPIVFYIEHTTPVRYRAAVKNGILAWNAAFERVGIRDCIEVRQQDALTGEHMEKDAEDVRYNFVRWLNNNISTAIGPSRVHPLTGEILDADIILTDGWIRHYLTQQIDVLPQTAMDGMPPATLAWLEKNPTWDPRLLLQTPGEAAHKKALAQRQATVATQPLDDDAILIEERRPHDREQSDPANRLMGGLGRDHRLCQAADGQSFNLEVMRLTYALLVEGEAAAAPGEAAAEKDILDGMPDEFISPLLTCLTAHEVGHTLGLRHNFKASGAYSLAELNRPESKGRRFAGSVMDYLPINIHMQDGKISDHFAMTAVGPYDLWAIEYGYTLTDDLKPILARVAEPELVYATDEDTFGPDPLARRYDLGADPLEYAKEQMRLAQEHRKKILDQYVKEGQSWAKARRGYQTTLQLQLRSLTIMADWVGGAHYNRDRKGDKNARKPLVVVTPQAQREALKFVIENSFPDAAFGLSPELVVHLSTDIWLDGGFGFSETAWPIHEQVMGLQGTILTLLLNPETLKLVYDNELRTSPDQDMVTLPELLDTVGAAVWMELDQPIPEGVSARKPWMSSLRRNLQRQYLERLIDLSHPGAGATAVHRPVSTLAFVRLEELKNRISKVLEHQARLDPYSRAHLLESNLRISKALDAHLVYTVR